MRSSDSRNCSRARRRRWSRGDSDGGTPETGGEDGDKYGYNNEIKLGAPDQVN